MVDYSEAAETIWAYANGIWFHDGAAGVPYVRADIAASQLADRERRMADLADRWTAASEIAKDHKTERDRLAADNARLWEALTDVLDRFVDAFPAAATYGPIIRARAAVENGGGNV